MNSQINTDYRLFDTLRQEQELRASIAQSRIYYMDKLRGMAEQFNEMYGRKEWGRANWILLQAEVIARFLELPQEIRSELFGQWPDDGDPDTVPPKGLFCRDKAREVGWHCCVRQHKTYQDIDCRSKGIPLPEYYSDDDYCALQCQHASPAHREEIEKLRA